MARVLLISANRCTAPDPVFPLGLACLSAALERAGHECRWFDVLAHQTPLEQVVTEFRPQFTGVSLRNVDDVLIRKRETYYDGLRGTCDCVRELSGCRVVIGGSGFSIFPRELLALSGADFGICGAGETALCSLLAALERGAPVPAIPGLVYRAKDSIVVVPPATGAHTVSLAEGDWPADVTDFYLRTAGALNVQTQRGCAFHCTYCTYPVIEGRTHHRVDPEAVADQFSRLARTGAKHVFIVDSVFNSSPRHITETCEALLRRNLKLPWACFLRPQGLTADLMRLMARAGLTHIEFGTDSFSDEVLAAYQKGFSFEDIAQANELAWRQKVDSCHFLIAGGPGETEATLQESYERSRLLPGAVMMAVAGMRIYPRTSLYARALAEGTIRPDTNLLEPCYYVAPGLESERLLEKLRGFAAASPNWIAGDPPPGYARLVERLRQRGIVGPLWSYLHLIQRLGPTGTPGAEFTLSPTGTASARRDRQ